MKILGAWRPILRNILEHMKISLEMTNLEILKHIIKDNYELVELILDIFGFNTADQSS
jgi:hypothetical protein